eukprot:m.220023 g.220023  ORF g.220023 m.220023 type:complete len:54 (-) comp15589_c0_seq2:13089-13250(-)
MTCQRSGTLTLEGSPRNRHRKMMLDRLRVQMLAKKLITTASPPHQVPLCDEYL